MGAVDKAKHEMEDLAGKVKEKVGDATDNESLQARGMAEQAKAKVEKAGDKMRDRVDDMMSDREREDKVRDDARLRDQG